MDEKYDVVVLGTGLKFGVKTNPDKYGRARDWNVDLIPKFLMAYGLVSFFEKRRLAHMLQWVVEVDFKNPGSYQRVYAPPLDVHRDSIVHAFDKFSIGESTQNFVGHALCLYPDDSYKRNIPADDAIKRMQLYNQSVARYGKSPYVYPLYGLGELPQAFARLSAVYGGTYMLNKPVEEIVLENGKVFGVKAEGEVARCDTVICDPSYAMDRVRKVGQVIRAICILSHPVSGARDAGSLQIIIPQNEVGRRHDIYISCVSSTHKVCPEKFYVALVATTVETPMPQQELKPGLDLLAPIDEVMFSLDNLYEPTEDGRESRVSPCSF
ncbi:Guanosine nucleotide diphosphate dissociation inhibitor [Fasciolopsis buskii]|uniref:Rab GDP dissociation inhibitor n=1 Tax=Fasciolopsis buskii TaxID=27845 RepID=A0A8E0VDR9_9TREM|nr:Guanosine nucleotide diphosphate dissociation inhibitor [Fasciolopsis buski]